MSDGSPFRDRVDAGRQLAERLARWRDEDVVVLGLPRGGVPVAAEVAHALGAPLDVIVVRKLGVPFQPELAMGAIGEDGVKVVNDELAGVLGVSDDEMAKVEERERATLEQRAGVFRQECDRVELSGRVVVIVDDGIATGSTAKAACQVVRRLGASEIVLAVPVAPPESVERFSGVADDLVCVQMPDNFSAVGQFYRDFGQTTDEEVVTLLARSSLAAGATAGSADDPPVFDDDVELPLGGVRLGGRLTVPEDTRGAVIFAHGSGSSRHSPRNRFVASVLNAAGVATLLFDLLTADEELDRTNVFDIELLAKRLVDATAWAGDQSVLRGERMGYFGASTGAAAALRAAGDAGTIVDAVVSRGGRPDLAGPRLESVQAPTLLIVGGQDQVVLNLNEQAQAQLRCENRLSVVPQATHLFEEPGALEAVADLTRDWFTAHLTAVSSR